MSTDRRERSKKLRFAFHAIPFWIVGAMSFAPVVIIGGNFLDDIKENWIAYSFLFTGVGIAAFAIGGWLRLGLRQRRDRRSQNAAVDK